MPGWGVACRLGLRPGTVKNQDILAMQVAGGCPPPSGHSSLFCHLQLIVLPAPLKPLASLKRESLHGRISGTQVGSHSRTFGLTVVQNVCHGEEAILPNDGFRVPKKELRGQSNLFLLQ